MTDAELIARKLGFLREHLERLRRRQSRDIEALRSDVDLQDALAMSLVVVVQEAIDIAFHMATDEGWGLPASYRESFEMLAAHNVIDEPLAGELGKTVQLRNRVAHGYASVDFERLHAELPRGLAAFEAFVTAVARHVAAC